MEEKCGVLMTQYSIYCFRRSIYPRSFSAFLHHSVVSHFLGKSNRLCGIQCVYSLGQGAAGMVVRST